MPAIRSAADIKGLWAAVPTPWTHGGRIDERALRTNVARYAAARVDGVYTTDSDGEFYAIELDEYAALVRIFADAMRDAGLRAQVGVTWSNTAGIVDRMRIALDCGINAFHVCFPYWMPMRRDEADRFWDTLAAQVPDALWVHYNTVRGHLVLNGADYRKLKKAHPARFVGTKLCSSSVVDLADQMAGTPEVAHFVTDFATVPAMMLGARGCCSFWVNTLPDWTRRMMDLALAGEWIEAMAMQKRFLEWENDVVAPVAGRGYLHGIIGKARGGLTDFLEDSGAVRAPYTPVPDELKRVLREGFARHLPEYQQPAVAATA